MKRSLGLLLLVALMLSLVTPAAFAKQYTIVNVPKVAGIAWFDRMKQGVERFAADTGHNAYQVGPSRADAALQVQIVEDLIAQGVDAITIVPFSVEALEPVLKKAREAGIVVIAHEASNIQNVDWDLEAFENEAYGARLMDLLAEAMGYEGEFATFVGSLTSKSHNEWIDGAMKRQQEKYPNMKVVAERLECYDDQTVAYNKMKELVMTYPNLKGIQTCASTAPPGAGLVLEEMGLVDEIAIVGTSLVSAAGPYLESGAVNWIGFWDPAEAAYAMNVLAVHVLEGKEIHEGMDLGVPGYNNLKIDGKVLYGEAWIFVNKDNMHEYDF
ncbi:MAG TPA: autoinducer 2 ABC transporter substrate-binding protein [Limnochordia bacterium]|nr:autoinducer 2 ABC transporter substrate-binding protein [Limnochordia bacterium]